MNPMKAEVKVLTVQALGADMDDALEAAERNVLLAQGGMDWLSKASDGLRSVSMRVDKDLDEGKITDSMSAMEIMKYVKGTMARAIQSLNDVALQAQTTKLAASGQVSGIKKCVEIAKKTYDQEKLKLEAYLVQAEKAARLAEEEGGDPAEAVVPRPRGNAAQADLAERKAQARAAKAKAAAKKATKKTATKKTARKKRSASNS